MIQFSHLGQSYQTDRVIGHVRGNDDGPTLVFFGGVHGNERSGVIALQQVFAELESRDYTINGQVIGLAGNLEALTMNQRFIEKDLNRIWNRRFRDSGLDSDRPPGSFEQSDQSELFQLLVPLLESGNECYFIDLHTTSAPSVPFIAINDQLKNRDFALQFSVPTVLGIEEYLEGTILSFLNDFGHVAMAFEAGQHDSLSSIQCHEAFTNLAMVTAGVVAKSQVPRWSDFYDILHREGSHLHGLYEVFFRHEIEAANGRFRMIEGFDNFDRVEKGQPLAADGRGELRSVGRGQIFMPLYQDEGDDGYFLVRKIPSWALAASRWFRRLQLDSLLTWLPGVSRSPDYPEALVVNRRIARLCSQQLFHLLGYRRKKQTDRQTVYVRREIAPLAKSPVAKPSE